MRMPVLEGMCAICELWAIGLAKLEGKDWFRAFLSLALLARSERHSRFHRRMNRRMEEAGLGINPELLNEITFVQQTEAGLEYSKIAPPEPDNQNENGGKIS
jgi:hypothetical protein